MEESSVRVVERIVSKLGFGDYKMQAYLALFRLGEGSISEISSESRVPQGKLYEIMKELEKEGYVSLVLASAKRYKIIAPDLVFDKIIKEKESQLVDLRADRGKIAELYTTIGQNHQPSLQLISGREKVLEILANHLAHSVTKSYWAVVAFNSFTTPLMSHIQPKIRQNLDIRIVGPPRKEDVARNYVKLGAKVRISEELKEPIRFSIYDGNKLAFTLTDTERNYITLWTDSLPLTANLANLFKYYWKSGREFNDSD